MSYLMIGAQFSQRQDGDGDADIIVTRLRMGFFCCHISLSGWNLFIFNYAWLLIMSIHNTTCIYCIDSRVHISALSQIFQTDCSDRPSFHRDAHH